MRLSLFLLSAFSVTALLGHAPAYSSPAAGSIGQVPSTARDHNQQVDVVRPGIESRRFSIGRRSSAHGVQLAPSGDIYVVGEADDETADLAAGTDLILVRLKPDLSLDSTFGEGGVARLNVGMDDIGYAVALQPDGAILVAGVAFAGYRDVPSHALPPLGDLLLARFTAAGVLDATFGNGGGVRRDLGPSSMARALAVDDTGRAVVLGTLGLAGVRWDESSTILVARFLPDGAADPTFGADGLVTVSAGWKSEGVAIALGQSGSISGLGNSVDSADEGPVYTSRMSAFRLNSYGAMDAAFGTAGIYRHRFGRPVYATGMIQDQGGSLLLGGYIARWGGGTALVKLRPDGRPAADFGVNGSVEDERDEAQTASCGLARLSDGTLVIGGRYYPVRNINDALLRVVRFSPDGALLASQPPGQNLTFDPGPGQKYAGALTIDASERVIIVGSAAPPNGIGQMHVVRIETRSAQS